MSHPYQQIRQWRIPSSAWRLAVAITVLAALTLGFVPQSTSAATTFYKLRGDESGKCMDVQGGGTANGTRVILWMCNGQANQDWKIIPYPDQWPSRYIVQSRLDPLHTKCLTVHGGGDENGAYLDIWDCMEQPNQIWSFNWIEGNLHRLVAVSSGKCATVNGGSVQNGAVLDQWDCLPGHRNQAWSQQFSNAL